RLIACAPSAPASPSELGASFEQPRIRTGLRHARPSRGERRSLTNRREREIVPLLAGDCAARGRELLMPRKHNLVFSGSALPSAASPAARPTCSWDWAHQTAALPPEGPLRTCSMRKLIATSER